MIEQITQSITYDLQTVRGKFQWHHPKVSIRHEPNNEHLRSWLSLTGLAHHHAIKVQSILS